MKQCIRIIGGLYRGKKIHFPALEGLRPTPDRVRETLFNWLMHVIRDANCLDAFAGSGALGIEAFSRGAKRVVLLEPAPLAYANLHKIASSFDTANLLVKKIDALKYIETTHEQFNLVFLDPPFATDYLQLCLEKLTKANVLAPQALVYVESPNTLTIDNKHWELLKSKKAGKVFYALYVFLGTS